LLLQPKTDETSSFICRMKREVEIGKPDARAREEFRKDQEPLIRWRVSIILLIGALLVPFFGALDYILYPKRFIPFISYRLIASLTCLVLFLINFRWNLGFKSFRLGILGFYVVGITIIAMIIQTGGYGTPYYAGLNLVFLTFCTVLTVRTSLLVLHSFILYAAYVASVILFSRSGQLGLFLANNMFVAGTIVIILVASLVNHRLRWREFLLRKELEAAQVELVRKERFAALGQLIATVSHEIRNPLGTVRTSLFSIGERVRDKGLGVERAIERAERNIIRCDRIIDELLGYSRDRMLDLQSTVLDDWLEDLLDEQKMPDGIVLEKDLQSGAVLEFDRESLRRGVLNIVSNAYQAVLEAAGGNRTDSSGQPGGRVRVETRSTGERAEILVIDTGKGIAPEEMEKVFQPLYSTKGFGVGLGLPIVKQIMEKHGGGIEIHNHHEQGVIVTLWLPMRKRDRVFS
jgi:signal transduction histidine kinase